MPKTLFLVVSIMIAAFQGDAQLLRRALFLGNSYTDYNNMPQLVANIAANRGDTLVFDSHSPGGYTLDFHSTDATSLAKIAVGNWDYLILQEQSQLPSMPAYFSNGLSGMCTAYRTANPCGRIMFYMTWGRMNGDTVNCPAWPPVCTYSGMDSLLRLRYVQTAVNSKAELSAVGAAWRYVRNNFPSINLYDADGSHPSMAGSYLAACCFYAAIFKKDPSQATYNYTVPASQAAQLRLAAKTVVFDSLSWWTYAPTTPSASFTYTVGAGINQVVCLNNSVDADTYLWDFGDGATSVQKHPTHSYSANGTYTITLTAYNCDMGTTYQASSQATVSFCPFTPTITPASLTLCPGSTDTLWTQNYSSYQWYDITGTPVPNGTSQFLVVSPNNSYYVKVSQGGCTEASVPVSVGSFNNLVTWYMVASGYLVGSTACIGDTIVLYTLFNKPPHPPDSLIDWAINGVPVAGYHNDSLLMTTGGSYKVTVRNPICSSLNLSQEHSFVFVPCPMGISEQDKKPPITVHPNPSSGVFLVSCEKETRLTIYDLFGRKLTGVLFTPGTHQINLQDHPPGIYLLEDITDEQKFTIKLLRQ